MTAHVVGSGGVPDSTYGSARRQPGEPHAAPAQAAAASEAPSPPGSSDLVLVIEQDAAEGGFIYTTLDRRTGAVIRKLNRAQLMKLREATSYAAGAVLSTRA
jgi:hypothetical protein